MTGPAATQAISNGRYEESYEYKITEFTVTFTTPLLKNEKIGPSGDSCNSTIWDSLEVLISNLSPSGATNITAYHQVMSD